MTPENAEPTPATRADPWARRARRAVPLALLGLAVLLVHGLLLSAWSPGRQAEAAPPSRALQVRQIVSASARPAVAPAPAAPVERPAFVPAVMTAALPVAPTVDMASAADPAPATESSPPAAAPAMVSPPMLAASPDGLSPSPAGGEEPPPTYGTRLPPPAVLRYELRRGALTGTGELRWQPGPEAYELSIDGSVFGLPVLSQVSRGGFDLAGLAPQRFVDRRRGRDLRAANFQRDRGLITYSGSPAQYPLHPGTQDRLSWMVQLAAIVDADPARFRPGTSIEMAVSGSRGDTDVWTFAVSGHEAVDLAGARLPRALLLRREPRKPFDTHVDVWLDPARHHLPVRIRLSNDRGAEPLEFVLEP